MTKVKICGLHSAADVAIVRELQPDYAGFICSPGFRRSVPAADIAAWTRDFPAQVKKVGVFVDARIERIVQLVQMGLFDLIQLHGQEDAGYLQKLRQLLRQAACPVQILQAVTVRRVEDLQKVQASQADYVLLDSGKGTGRTFDWSLLASVQRPFFLAGGLTAENAGRAMAEFHPYAIDVSSGVETDGKKDFWKVKRLLAVARQAQ